MQVDEGFEVETPQRGLGRVFAVVLLVHLVVIGGILAFQQLDDGGIERSPLGKLTGSDSSGANGSQEAVDDLLPPMRTNGKSIVVDHPYLEGHKRYRVGEGETLVQIVRQFNASVAEVEQLNDLRPGGKIFTGQWLTIPDNTGNAPRDPLADDGPAPVVKAREIRPQPGTMKPVPIERPVAEGAKPDVRAATASSGRTYQVKRGDTLYRIAQRYGVGVQDLLKANNLDDPRKLQVGQVLRIPQGS